MKFFTIFFIFSLVFIDLIAENKPLNDDNVIMGGADLLIQDEDSVYNAALEEFKKAASEEFIDDVSPVVHTEIVKDSAFNKNPVTKSIPDTSVYIYISIGTAAIAVLALFLVFFKKRRI